MSNKMLIDASHPEETRVAVVRGNRVEEYDFESQEKKQLRGNIYLAKVTRVEPSLQAAFVDYGGNRHGFLAFSEIHPDYYQIPMADRQALLEAEAEDARASRDAEEAEDNVTEVTADNDDDTADDESDTPKKKPRRRRSRKAKTSGETAPEQEVSEEDGSDASALDPSQVNEDDAEQEEKPKRRSTRRKKAPVSKKAADEATESTEETDEQPAETSAGNEESEQEEEKPKRRSTRRKKAPVKKAEADDTEGNDDDDDDDDDTPTTMAAIIEMDSISEDLPDANDEGESSDEESESVAEEKPKRRSTRRKASPAKKKATEDNPSPEETEQTATQTDEANSSEETTSDQDGEEEKSKPKKRAPRRKPRAKKSDKTDEDTDAKSDDTADDNSEEDENRDEGIESVGQEDALEEVPTPPRRQRRHYKIQEVIKRRQVLLVQVVKEERGNKGAALTTYLSLAGRYSVLMPNTARGGGISRKITNAADRKRLKAVATGLDVPDGMGVILRTAGASRTNAEIERDFDYLMRLWEQVRNLTLSSSAPCLVYEEGSLIKRSIRDLYDKDTGEVVVAGENGFKEAKDFMTMLMPNATNKVKLHRDKQSIFAKFGVETQLDKMVTPQVTLKSGGYLIIDQTEALVAVDVNSGRSTREHSIENTALQTNLEAAEEVARQLRLRDLAGLIVIDFIDMEEKRNNRAVEKKLKDCLKNDRARIQVGRISHFGLMEMSRQRMRASVLESTMDVCSMCGGTGHVRSDSAIALHVFRAIEEHVSRHNRYDAVIKTTPAIAMHILNHKREALVELENRYGLSILIEGTNQIKGQDFEITKGELATGEVKSTAVGYQDASVDEAEDDDKNTRGKKRGRGRRKNQEDHNQSESDNAQTDSEESKSESDQDTEASDNDDDQKPRKKRRRGKRGGRRNNAGEDSAEESSDGEAASKPESTEQEEPQAVTAKTSDDVSANTDESSEQDEKPKSRSTTRRKAPVTKKEPVAEAPSVDTQEVKPAEPEKPKRRRTTRRVKPDEDVSTNETAEQEDKPAEKTSSTEEVADASSETSKDDTQKDDKKKKGWWNRGGGFF